MADEFENSEEQEPHIEYHHFQSL